MKESKRQKRRAKTMDNGAGGAIGLIKPANSKRKQNQITSLKIENKQG